MVSSIRISKLAPISIVLVSLMTLIPHLSFSMSSELFNWSIMVGTLIIFSVLPFYAIKPAGPESRFIKIIIVYYLFSFIHGIFVAETYWDSKGLIGNSAALLMAVIALTSLNMGITRKILVVYLGYSVPMILLFLPFLDNSGVGNYLAPISILILFLPIFPRPWPQVFIVITIYLFVINLGARSTIIKFTIPYLLLIFYYVKIFRSIFLMNLLRNVLFVIPIIFFWLGVTGTFNIFRINEYVESDLNYKSTDSEGNEYEESLGADTRTLLYVEVLATAKKHNSWLIGRSPARGNETKIFAGLKKITGRAERLGNEVAILNIFTWTGLIGVLLHFLVLYRASYLAVNKSNNIFSKLLGIYIAFRWLYGWVEDINYFTITTFSLWLFIGLCYSDKFRNMSNLELKLWLQGIRYRKISRKEKFTKDYHATD